MTKVWEMKLEMASIYYIMYKHDNAPIYFKMNYTVMINFSKELNNKSCKFSSGTNFTDNLDRGIPILQTIY